MFNDKTNKSSLKTIADIKNLNNAFGYKQFVSTALAVSMLSGFALTAFSSDVNPTVQVNAAPTTLYSTDFGSGTNPGTPITETEYNYYGGNYIPNEGDYSILNNSEYFSRVSVEDIWVRSTDHTGNMNGYMFASNGTTVPGQAIFKKNLTLAANANITISYWVKNADNTVKLFELYPSLTFSNPQFGIELRETSGNLINSSVSSEIPGDSQWYKQSISTFNSTAQTVEVSLASYQPIGNGNDFYLDDILITQEIITLGTPVATTVSPIVGVVGVSPFPTINMTGSSLPDNTIATFTPAGSPTVTTGTIVGGNFVPTSGQIVPANATQGPTTGTLKSAGAADVMVATNFVAPTFGNLTVYNNLRQKVGDPFPTIGLTGGNLPDGTLANLIVINSSTVNGQIIGGNFVPNPGYFVEESNRVTGLYLTSAGVPGLLIGTNFNPIEGPIIGGVAGSSFLEIIDIYGTNIPDGTIANFASPGSSTIVTGTVINSYFIPDMGQFIPVDSTVGRSSGVLSFAGYPDQVVRTEFETPQIFSPIAGQVGNPFPIIYITGFEGFNGTPVAFFPAGSNTTITGEIVGGNFIPNEGQIIPLDATTGSSVSYIIQGGEASYIVPTNFTPIPVASSSSSSETLSSSSIITSSSLDSSTNSSNSSTSSSSSSSSIPASIPAISSTTSSSSSSTFNSSLTIISSIIDDNDGVAPIIESAAPNNGDANKDTFADAMQNNVASLPDISNSDYVAVSLLPSSDCQTLSNISVNTEVQNGSDDLGYDYPVGFVNFNAPCATSVKVKMYWYGLDTTKTYINRKFRANGSSYELVGNNIVSAVENVDGVDVWTYTYEVFDNQEGDEDPTVGNIIDPIGPAIQVVNSNINSGGIITIGTNSITSIVNSSSQIASVELTNSVSSSIIEKNLSNADEIKLDSKNISTIRTGGDSNDLLALIMILLGVGLAASIMDKQKRSE
jgi:hypothetical protein